MRVAQQAVEHRQVEAQALARGGAGGDDEVLAALGDVPRGPLVQPERPHALGAQGLGQQGVQTGRQGRRSALVRRAHDFGLDLLEALRGQDVEEGRFHTKQSGEPHLWPRFGQLMTVHESG